MDAERVKNGLKTINETLDTFIAEADLVTCSTEYLRQEYLKLNPNVITIPNCVDPFYFDEPLKNENGKVRIGIIGSLALTDDIDLLEPIVRHYEKDPRVEIILFSLPPARLDKYTRELYAEEYKFWESVNVEWQPLVEMQEYYDTLNNLKLDICIIPRADNYFNRCKSNLKFLEASMLEIPTIAQGFPDGQSPYEVDPEDVEHLVLVKDNDKWIETIEDLVVNKEKRQKMGIEAKKYVEDKYGIDNNAHRWVGAYKTLCKEE
jgi:glycosyltransferase involved in cell wall biosynthesis